MWKSRVALLLIRESMPQRAGTPFLTMVIIGGCMLLARSASAEFMDNFETVVASPGGTILTEQAGWYLPVGGSVDYRAYTYTGNALALPPNPTGHLQFVAGTGQGDPSHARAQHDVTYGSGVWAHAYDFAAKFVGTPPATDNVGSFSIQAAPNDYIHLFSWVPSMEGSRFRAFYIAYSTNGVQDPQPGRSPGPAWDNLAVNHWYRAATIVDYDLNRIIEVRIKDLETNDESSFSPPDWYLEGGAAGSTAPATALRLFSGGATAGNVVAFDNVGACVRRNALLIANDQFRGAADLIENALLNWGSWQPPFGIITKKEASPILWTVFRLS